MLVGQVDRRGKADINFSSTADQTIIAAPGVGKHIEIDFMVLFPVAATTIQLKDGTTPYGGPLALDAKQSLTIENSSGWHSPIILSDNSAFVVNSSVATQVSGWAMFRIVGD